MKALGILMIFSLFAGLFGYTVYERGIIEAIIGWCLIALLLAFISLASYFIEEGSK